MKLRDALALLQPKVASLNGENVPQTYLQGSHEHKRFARHSQEEKAHSFLLMAREMEDFWQNRMGSEGQATILHGLLAAADRYLLLRDNAAVVRFEKMLAWRMLTTAIGQDLPVCAYLAWQDHRMGRERLEFTWPLHLPCDNAQLRGMLQQGMAENHYHLWGSVPSFHLLWLRLMGDTRLHEQVLKEPLKERLYSDHVGQDKQERWPLDDLSRLAAIIRWHLHTGDKASIPLIQKMLRKKGATQWELSVLGDKVELESATASAGWVGGYPVDYALSPGALSRNSNDGLPLAFERQFLYCMCKRLLNDGGWASEQERERSLHLFYLYILIKAKVRRDYVQVNDRVGFHNFKVYQDRKGDYAGTHRGRARQFFDFWGTRLAITRPLKEMPIRMLEARIAPPKMGDSPHVFEQKIKLIVEAAQTDLRQYLQHSTIRPIDLEKVLGVPKDEDPPELTNDRDTNGTTKGLDIADRLYFVIHFLKKPDHALPTLPGSRHAKLREELRQQSQCLWAWHETGSYWAGYIRGIDAASTEIGCRPEVFAHAFRFLRLFQPRQSRLLDPSVQAQHKELRVTYHVGEDFLDLVDGLRAIEEALLFLEYRRGDRLGHALALGVEAANWYADKGNVVMLPLQDLVDNLAWMHGHLVTLGDSRHLPLIAKLERDWQEYYGRLVKESNDELKTATIHQYYLSWKLRGDEPDWYAEGKLQRNRLQQPWQLSALTQHPKMDLDVLRNQKHIVTLYHHYHYCQHWKRAGRQIMSYEIEKGYITAASSLQRYFQLRIRDLGIGIETNPSSNYLIGTFQRYDKHPLPSLHNLGLSYDPEALAANPQMHISINTDDLGIFDTSLENEYALMAVALGKMKNADGNPAYSPAMIMDWLDRVRAMGLQQSFRSPGMPG